MYMHSHISRVQGYSKVICTVSAFTCCLRNSTIIGHFRVTLCLCFKTKTRFETEAQGNGRSNPEVVGSIPTEVKRFFSLPRVVP